MRQYEITYLISDLVPESDLNKVTGKVGGYVSATNGKILKEEIWGRRKLAYPIGKQDFATYVTVNFEIPAEKAREFERNIFLTGKIIRHLMIVTDYGAEELSLSKDELVKTEEIEKVIGGERSFEAVEGETEESKGLMLKREEVVSETPTEEIVEEEKKETPEISEEAKPKITKKKVKTEEKVEPVKEDEPSAKAVETVAEEKPKKEKKIKKVKEPEHEEVDRLSKLDKELDDILGDDL